MPKAPPRLCRAGHRQNSNWKLGDDCWQCDRDEAAALLRDPSIAAAFRAEKMAEIGPIPTDMTLRAHDGSVISHTIPRRLMRRR